MMSPTLIVHRLDLVLRLLDTSTGRDVSASEVSLFKDGKLLHPLEKEKGTMIFPGLGREDFTLSLKAKDYESVSLPVRFDELDEKTPTVELHLIPSDVSVSPMPCLTLSGQLPGISELTAVRLGDTSCLVREFDTRKKLMTIFNPHKLELGRTHYALVNSEGGRFERFAIVKRVDDKTVKLDRALESEFGSNWPICPVVFGRTDSEGNYLLRVRDDAAKAKWLIRCMLGDEERFYIVDMKSTTKLPLKTDEADVKREG